jgi:hypothetical protein
MKHLISILAFFMLFSCGEKRQQIVPVSKTNDETEFKIPIISQNHITDAIVDFPTKNINSSFFEVAVKTFPSDTLKISLDFYQDSSVWKDLNRHIYDTIFNNVSYDGFEIQTDYSSSVYKTWLGPGKLFQFYPIYIINKTSRNKYFPGKDSYAFGIQEAVDTNGIWRPIEGRGFDFCGNGYWNLRVGPNESLVLLAPKYKGNYSTKLRVRIKIGTMIYVSKGFDGYINYNQFLLEKDSHFADCLKEDKTATIQDIFYGSNPLGVKKNQVVTHAVYAQQR